MSGFSQHDPDPLLDAVLAVGPQGRAGEVLIAGGGISGLALALALAQRHIASHILERQSVFSEAGAGIQIGPNGSRILEALGVLPALIPLAGRPEAIVVIDAGTGREIARLPLGSWIEARHGAPYITLHRKDLHAALAAKVRDQPLIRLSMAHDIEAVRENTEAVAVRCSGDRRYGARVLIGADGLWSAVRTAAQFTEAPLRPAGYLAARAVIPATALPAGDAVVKNTYLQLSPTFHGVHYPVRGGREIAVVVVLKGAGPDHDWNSLAPDGLIAPVIASAAPDLARLLRQAPEWRTWSLHALPRLRSAARGRIALIGDAAHPILPFLAQGGVLALEDAVTLASALAREAGDIPSALASYAQARKDRVRSVVGASQANGRIYHLGGALKMARDFTLGRAAPQKLMARYDWLYGWRAD